MKWNAYPEFKPSGVEWLGEIPGQWVTLRLKFLATVNNDVLGEDTDPDFEMLYVDISSVDAVSGIQTKEPMRFEGAPSRARRRVRQGDVIVSTVRTYLRSIAPIVDPEPNLIVSTGFAVVRPQSKLNSTFAAYALRSPYFVDAVVARSVGVSYPAINASDLMDLRIAIPSIAEQRPIAAFLDRETARIDALIAKKERQIELLQEKRVALIGHAVKRGLNCRVPLRDSRIPWLGPIPGHWELKRAKYLFHQSALPVRGDDEVVTCFRDGQVTLRRNRREEGFTNAIKELGYQGIRAGQLVLHSMDAFAGAIGVSDSDGKCSPEYIICDPVNHSILNMYYGHLLRVMAINGFIQASCPAVRERAPRIRFPDFGEMFLPVPKQAEQHAIVVYIANEMAKLCALRSAVEKTISLLKERRTVLISAAVTGKIDVRGEVA